MSGVKCHRFQSKWWPDVAGIDGQRRRAAANKIGTTAPFSGNPEHGDHLGFEEGEETKRTAPVSRPMVAGVDGNDRSKVAPPPRPATAILEAFPASHGGDTTWIEKLRSRRTIPEKIAAVAAGTRRQSLRRVTVCDWNCADIS